MWLIGEARGRSGPPQGEVSGHRLTGSSLSLLGLAKCAASLTAFVQWWLVDRGQVSLGVPTQRGVFVSDIISLSVLGVLV